MKLNLVDLSLLESSSRLFQRKKKRPWWLNPLLALPRMRKSLQPTVHKMSKDLGQFTATTAEQR